MSSASPTWKQKTALECQVGTAGFGLGQLSSCTPNGLPSISAGNASPGLSISCRSGPMLA